MLLPPDIAFTDAVVSGRRSPKTVYEGMRRAFVQNWFETRSNDEGRTGGQGDSVARSVALRAQARKDFAKATDVTRRLLLSGMVERAKEGGDRAWARELQQALALLTPGRRRRSRKMDGLVARCLW